MDCFYELLRLHAPNQPIVTTGNTDIIIKSLQSSNHPLYFLYHSPMNLHPKIAMPMFISFLPFRPKTHTNKNTNTTGATLPLERKVCVSDPPTLTQKRGPQTSLDRASAGPPKSPETPDAKTRGFFFLPKTVEALGVPGLN